MGSSAFAPPTSFEWGNYSGAWARGHFGTTVLNSAVMFGTMLPFQVMLAPLFTLVNCFGSSTPRSA